MNTAATPIMSISDSPYATLLILAGLFVIVILLPRALKRKPTGSGSSAVRPAAPLQAREQMDSLVVKLDDLGRELYAKLDTKIRILDRLLQEAEEKIKKLQAMNAAAGVAPEPKARQAESKQEKPAGATKSAASNPPGQENSKYAGVYVLADAGHDVISIARQTGLQPGEIELLLELRKNKSKDEQ
jgi:hypothetical protein